MPGAKEKREKRYSKTLSKNTSYVCVCVFFLFDIKGDFSSWEEATTARKNYVRFLFHSLHYVVFFHVCEFVYFSKKCVFEEDKKNLTQAKENQSEITKWADKIAKQMEKKSEASDMDFEGSKKRALCLHTQHLFSHTLKS